MAVSRRPTPLASVLSLAFCAFCLLTIALWGELPLLTRFVRKTTPARWYSVVAHLITYGWFSLLITVPFGVPMWRWKGWVDYRFWITLAHDIHRDASEIFNVPHVLFPLAHTVFDALVPSYGALLVILLSSYNANKLVGSKQAPADGGEYDFETAAGPRPVDSAPPSTGRPTLNRIQ